jgi:hypothetical protein
MFTVPREQLRVVNADVDAMSMISAEGDERATGKGKGVDER